jgi:plastocyanin
MQRAIFSPRRLAMAGAVVLLVAVALVVATVLVPRPVATAVVPAPAGQPQVTLWSDFSTASTTFLVRIDCGSVSVSVCTNGFYPKNVTIPAGSAVTWLSEESGSEGVYHRVIFRVGGTDSGQMDGRDEFTATFPSPGVYQYYDFDFPGNNGTITVVPSG